MLTALISDRVGGGIGAVLISGGKSKPTLPLLVNCRDTPKEHHLQELRVFGLRPDRDQARFRLR